MNLEFKKDYVQELILSIGINFPTQKIHSTMYILAH